MLKFPNIDPVLIHITKSISINWYAIPYLMGFLLCRYSLMKLRTSPDFTPSEKQVDDICSIGLLGGILGARAMYVLVYNPLYYKTHLIKIFAIWEGGLSFHGGIVGGVALIALYCKKNAISMATIFDNVSIVIPIAIFFGRIANFINGELYGRPTNSMIGIIFPFDPLQLPRHPSQLYESLSEGLLLFIVMIFCNKNKKIQQTKYCRTLIFLGMYSFFRFFIEFFRDPDQSVGFVFKYLTLGQIFSVICFTFSFYKIFKITKNSDEELQKNADKKL